MSKQSLHHGPDVSDHVLKELMYLVSKLTGNQLGQSQTHMVRYRILKRVTELSFKSGDEYLEFVREHIDEESKVLVGILTTHHTFFFREFNQFEFLEKEVLPKLIKKMKSENRKVLKVWSAACSRGQEVYSLAMFLNHHLSEMDPEMDFEILGTDVDEASVTVAKNGVYKWDEIKEIPSIYLLKNWARGTGDIAQFAKVKKHLKDKCRFKSHNILKPVLASGIKEQFDIIFCRNLFIYFNPTDIRQASQHMIKTLHPDGAFFIGLSENLMSLGLPVTGVGPSVYAGESSVLANKSAAVETAKSSEPDILKVLCVDDSPTVLMLLKKILVKEHGFEIVGTASNGLDAAEKAKKLKFDLMTLDIHMPEQNGIEYLQKNWNQQHPAVVVISSISREEKELGLQALSCGARDYVEKPNLKDLTVRAEEIRNKLRSAYRSKDSRADVKLEKSFERTVKVSAPDKCLRVLFVGLDDRERLAAFIKQRTAHEPGIVIAVKGASNSAGLFKDFLLKNGIHSRLLGESSELKQNEVYIADQADMSKVQTLAKSLKTSLMVLGHNYPSLSLIKGWSKSELLLEDTGDKNKTFNELKPFAAYCVPFISFKYHSDSYLGSV